MNLKSRLNLQVKKPEISSEPVKTFEQEELERKNKIEVPTLREVPIEKNTDKVFSVIEQRIISLASSGMSGVSIASMLNVDKSYVSQILGKEHITEAVQLKTLAINASYQELDDKWDSLEEALLDKVTKQLPFLDVKAATNLLIAANNAKRRRGLEQQIANQNNQINVTNITLPSRIVSRFTVNENNEITEVDGKILDTMPSRNLLNKYESDITENIDRQIEAQFPKTDKAIGLLKEVMCEQDPINLFANFVSDEQVDERAIMNLRAEDL